MKFQLRPACSEDLAFVERVFNDVRAPEFELAGLTGPQLAQLLAVQFRAQRTHYERAYPEREDSIIEVDGQSAGEWLIAELPAEIRLIDVSLLRQFRGQGIGTSLLTGLLARAQEAQKPIVLHVEMQNPAKRLYDRFGFKVEEEVGIYWRMRWVQE